MRTTLAFILVASLSIAGCAKKNPPAAAPKNSEPSATEKAPAADSAAQTPAKASEDPCAGGEKMPDKK